MYQWCGKFIFLGGNLSPFVPPKNLPCGSSCLCIPLPCLFALTFHHSVYCSTIFVLAPKWASHMQTVVLSAQWALHYNVPLKLQFFSRKKRRKKGGKVVRAWSDVDLKRLWLKIPAMNNLSQEMQKTLFSWPVTSRGQTYQYSLLFFSLCCQHMGFLRQEIFGGGGCHCRSPHHDPGVPLSRPDHFRIFILTASYTLISSASNESSESWTRHRPQ